jgi:hypothetical protein
MTRSACLTAASALALATVLSTSIAGAKNVGEAGQRIAPLGSVIGQSGGFRIPLVNAAQSVAIGEAGAAGASSASQPVSGSQKLAKIEVDGEAKAAKLDASPASEQKPASEIEPNDASAVADVAKNVSLQPAVEAKPDRPVEPPRAPAERQPAAEVKVEQQPAPEKAKEARAEVAPLNSAPSVDRVQLAVQAGHEQKSGSPAFIPREPRNFGYRGHRSRPIYNRQCNH